MAILHRATLSPTKLELLTAHAKTFPSLIDVSEISLLGAYRFDDPAGKVGMEAHLVNAGPGAVLHVPLTYREAPLPGADAWLLTMMEHSALGTRWVYNACSDPVYVKELVRTILTGGSNVEQFVATTDGPKPYPSTASAVGSGTPDASVPEIESVRATFDGTNTVITAGGLNVVVRHLLTELNNTVTGPKLTGTWPDNDAPATFAYIRQ
jgi:Maltokinase N-terminal cap domain